MLLAVLATSLVVFVGWLVSRRELLRCLREPMLRTPVLVFESDDWSPGPAEHATALREIADVLQRYRDQEGRHPRFALGLVLSVPARMEAGAPESSGYRRVTFGDPRMAGLLEAVRQGVADGVFSLQLHGMEHFWPPAVLARAAEEPAIARWLAADEYPQSEGLPSELQSRWTDARRLPSSPHSPAEVRAAVSDELAAFAALFGQAPAVFVPPTFVWTEAVERALAAGGVGFLVTPGRRFVGRGAEGALLPDRTAGPRRYWNGRRLASGLVALVRDLYFEPGYGHRTDAVLPRIARHVALGRPVLLETHRFNFIGDAATRQGHLAALAELIEVVLERWPDVRFLSTAELADAYAGAGSPAVEFETGLVPRLRMLVARLSGERRLRRTLAAAAAVQAVLIATLLVQAGFTA